MQTVDVKKPVQCHLFYDSYTFGPVLSYLCPFLNHNNVGRQQTNLTSRLIVVDDATV